MNNFTDDHLWIIIDLRLGNGTKKVEAWVKVEKPMVPLALIALP